MVRLVVHLEGASERLLFEETPSSPRLEGLVAYRGSLQQAPGSTPRMSRRITWPHVLRPAEADDATGSVAAHQALVRKVARLARSDLLADVTRVELPLVTALRKAGEGDDRAHALAAEALLALNRVVGPEVLVVTWSGAAPQPETARVDDAVARDGPGWRSSVPIPAWTEADLLIALQSSA